ncbi:glycosyltransferase [Epibacterium ulvae]|uniref:glycosyltransferase n=1 Tax=Epibacterium ulvae TaxID=1156985 RepID=UPI001BFCA648|nr:glycosyltransferase family 2 protein [Epibacterium ulvae]MBT8155923.1 glycosyltransferase [Epibacterium ulvae]
MSVDICICTFRRAHIADTLLSIEAAEMPQGHDVRIIVTDNDDDPSAQELVENTAKSMTIPVFYQHVPGRNISIARNAGLDTATADWVAFLDDDELVTPDWLTNLFARQNETNADAVFGHSRADYDKNAPDWIVKGDFHSQFAVMRGGEVETGHTCNALVRWSGTSWQDVRFDLARGKSGGEDTEFFFRMREAGALFVIADNSIVHEEVPPSRLSLQWLLRRRYRIGQSYSAHAASSVERVKLFVLASVKAGYCFLRAVPALGQADRKAFWLMRGTMHAGVCAGCLGLSQRALYGDTAPQNTVKQENAL